MRDCPRGCGSLQARISNQIEVDLCPMCEGIWLDAGEFDPLVAERFAGRPVEEFLEANARTNSGDDVLCPVDGSAMMQVSFLEHELDWCSACHGVWIDGSEREELRATQASEAMEEQGLELDFEAVAQVGRVEDVDVVCGACGATVSRLSAMKKMDAFWCEECVVLGNYPGSHGPPVSKRMAEAARLFAQANATQAEKRDAYEDVRKSMKSRGRFRGGPTPEVSVGLGSVVRSLKSLFFGDRDS